MTIVQQMQCRKEFALFCAQHRIPVGCSPEYKQKVYHAFETCWNLARNPEMKKAHDAKLDKITA